MADVVDLSQCESVRIFVNGCWDLAHSGHFNAFRLARARGAALVGSSNSRVTLVVGIHPNDEIRRVKGGAFVTSEAEKEVVLRGCKFVDEVVHGIPYDEISPELLDREDIRCHFACHGDDPVVLPSGIGMYDASRASGRYLEFRRTEGISTTSLIDRLLSHKPPELLEFCALTAQRMVSFSQGSWDAGPEPRNIVYVDGDWDMFHAGHICVLEEMSRRGSFILVGVHGPDVVRAYRGPLRPIMSTGERALALLACRHVGDVVFDAPLRPSPEFLRTLGISAVIHVSGHDDFIGDEGSPTIAGRFQAAADAGILSEFVPRAGLLATRDFFERVEASRESLEARQVKKKAVAAGGVA